MRQYTRHTRTDATADQDQGLIFLRRQRAVRRPLDRPRSGIAQLRILGQPAQDAHSQVVADLDLARKSRLWLAAGHALQPLFLGRRNRARLTTDYLDAAGRAAGIAAAAMQDVDTRILDGEHKSPPVARGDDGLDPLNCYLVQDTLPYAWKRTSPRIRS
jgi:hypothetical protein